ncbi:hypothetical protein H072_8400 [Dactylellina haptotyla CBS 200.50]|uniref:Peptidase A1 domain-containing protein n=1 Tax=Dactylellina haptotyla (strain CBS 200.50) TaxID=1284197 RepID=S8A9X8_DACHA|nr:hypothetical protein H072_8400 [Dactylellina haptotyla CBS 200.50]
MLFKTFAVASLAVGATALPMYMGIKQDTSKNQTWTNVVAPSMPLKRSSEPLGHPVVRSVQKLNYAMDRHAKRSGGLVKRTTIDSKVFEFTPLRKRQQPLTIIKVLGQDSNGDIIVLLSDGEEAVIPASALTGNGHGNGNGNANGGAGNNGASGFAAANQQPGAVVPQTFDAASQPTQGASVALNEDGADITYFALITIGSNKKQFQVIMDTGSSDLWVPAAGASSTHSTLSQADSQSLVISNSPFSIQYGSGSVAGVLAKDTVNIAGMGIQTTFGLSQQLSQQFDQFQPDGLMGLATSKASSEGVTVPLQVLKDTNQIPAALIGVHLARAGTGTNDGAINFGKIDPSFIKGGDANSLTFSDNISADGLWEINLEDMTVNGQTLGLSPSTAIIDTGTTLMIVPQQDAVTIHAALHGASQTNQAGTFTLPCDTTSTLQVKFGGQTLDISHLDYVGAPINQGSNTCVSNIMGGQIGGPNQMLLGDVFLKNVYSVFNLDTNQVGFAPSAENAQAN